LLAAFSMSVMTDQTDFLAPLMDTCVSTNMGASYKGLWGRGRPEVYQERDHGMWGFGLLRWRGRAAFLTRRVALAAPLQMPAGLQLGNQPTQLYRRITRDHALALVVVAGVVSYKIQLALQWIRSRLVVTPVGAEDERLGLRVGATSATPPTWPQTCYRCAQHG
jgi:hypothetical protein